MFGMALPTDVRRLYNTLSDKQKTCIKHYISNGNKVAAYRFAYDIKPDTKVVSVNRNAWKFFNGQKIKRIVDHLQARALEKLATEMDSLIDARAKEMAESDAEMEAIAIDATWVLYRAALLADFNIRKFLKIDEKGNAVYDFSGATDDDWYCIQEYTVDEIARGSNDDKYFVDQLKIKGHDKIRALELVGKHINVKAFKEVTEVEHLGMVATCSIDEYKEARQQMLDEDDC